MSWPCKLFTKNIGTNYVRYRKGCSTIELMQARILNRRLPAKPGPKCRQSEVLMTWAMCLNCGDIKGGALVPCSKCDAPATGNLALDIAFSDHRIPRDKLLELGSVVSEIHRICEDRSLCLWTFLQYVTLHHPSILEIDLKAEAKDAVEQVLSRLNVSPLSITSSELSPWPSNG